MSCKTSTVPLTLPALRIGAPTRVTDTVLPSRRWISLECSLPPVSWPLWMRSISVKPSAWAFSSSTLNRAASGRPVACSAFQWVNTSAAGFM
ncbi:hypothetical protein D3C73_1134790 [compost metagenome]